MSGATTDWQARRSRATRHAPDLTATVAREPVSDAMLTLAEAEGGTVPTYDAPRWAGQPRPCPNCGRASARAEEYYAYSIDDILFADWAEIREEHIELDARSAADGSGWPGWVAVAEVRCCGEHGGAVLRREVIVADRHEWPDSDPSSVAG